MTWRRQHSRPRSSRHRSTAIWTPTRKNFDQIGALWSAQNRLTEHVVEPYTTPFFATGGALIEHTGDVYRGLTQNNGIAFPWGYIEEKIGRLERTEDWDLGSLHGRRTSTSDRLTASSSWDTSGLPMFLDRVNTLRTKTIESSAPPPLKDALLASLSLQDTLALFIAEKTSSSLVRRHVANLRSKLDALKSTPWTERSDYFALQGESQ